MNFKLNIYASEDTVNKVERQSTEWENLCKSRIWSGVFSRRRGKPDDKRTSKHAQRVSADIYFSTEDQGIKSKHTDHAAHPLGRGKPRSRPSQCRWGRGGAGPPRPWGWDRADPVGKSTVPQEVRQSSVGEGTYTPKRENAHPHPSVCMHVHAAERGATQTPPRWGANKLLCPHVDGSCYNTGQLDNMLRERSQTQNQWHLAQGPLAGGASPAAPLHGCWHTCMRKCACPARWTPTPISNLLYACRFQVTPMETLSSSFISSKAIQCFCWTHLL